MLRNPVSLLKHYRLYTIYRIPSLKVLDFKKVKDRERAEAQKLYKGKKLKKSNESNKAKTFVPGEQLDKLTLGQSGGTGFDQKISQQGGRERVQPSKEDIEAIRALISQAKSIEEIEKLNAILRSGQIPSHLRQQQQPAAKGQEEDEEMQ